MLTEKNNIDVNEENNCPNPEIPEVAAKKNSKSRFKIFFAGILAVFMVIVIALSSATVQNSLIKSLVSKDLYLRYTIFNALNGDSANLMGVFENGRKLISPEQILNGEIKVNLSDGLGLLLKDANLNEIKEITDDVKTVKLGLSNKKEDGKLDTVINVNANDTDILNLKSRYDRKNKVFYIGSSDKNEIFLERDVTTESVVHFLQDKEKCDEILASLPKDSKLFSVIKSYIKCVLNEKLTVSEKEDTIFADGLSQNATLLSVAIDEELLLSTAQNVISKLKTDKNVKEIILNISNTKAVQDKNLYDKFISQIERIEEEIKKEGFFESLEGTLNLWVGSKGEIVGVSFKNDNISITNTKVKKLGKFAVSYEVKKDGESVKFIGNGKENDNFVSGDFTLKHNELPLLTVNCDELDLVRLKTGIIKGEVTLGFTDNLKPVLNISDKEEFSLKDLSVSIKSKKASLEKTDAKIEVTYKKKSCIGINLEAKKIKAQKVNIKNTITANTKEGILKWWKSVFEEDLSDNLKKAGISKKTIEKIGNMFSLN